MKYAFHKFIMLMKVNCKVGREVQGPVLARLINKYKLWHTFLHFLMRACYLLVDGLLYITHDWQVTLLLQEVEGLILSWAKIK